MGPVIAEDVKRLLLQVEEIAEVDVEFVFDPPWDRSMMSEAANSESCVLREVSYHGRKGCHVGLCGCV